MKILLPVDESTFSQDAIEAVTRQFQRRGTEVLVLHVIQPISAYLSADLIPHFTPQVTAIERDRRREADEIVAGATRKLRSAGFKSSALVVMGHPTTEIVAQAERWRADVIVIASYGLRGLNRLLLGSVSEAVARHADCSVEIVRARRPSSRTTRGKSPKP